MTEASKAKEPSVRTSALTWEAASLLLEEAFRRLPVWRPETGKEVIGIPYEMLIPGIPHQLLHMQPSSYHLLLKTPALRRPIEVKVRAVKKKVDDLAKTLEALNALADPVTAIIALRLKLLLAELKQSAVVLDSSLVTYFPRLSASGPPIKVQPRKIAVVVASHYWGITGARPTLIVKEGRAGGPFFDLLSSVFTALRVRASVANMARHAIGVMEKSGPTFTP